jgi:hypothetical protein
VRRVEQEGQKEGAGELYTPWTRNKEVRHGREDGSLGIKK